MKKFSDIGNICPIPFSLDVLVGDPVITIGCPYSGVFDHNKNDDSFSYRVLRNITTAHVSALVRWDKMMSIQFDNVVGPGNSGAPLINCRTGLAIGIVRKRGTDLFNAENSKKPGEIEERELNSPYSYATFPSEFASQEKDFFFPGLLKIHRK